MKNLKKAFLALFLVSTLVRAEYEQNLPPNESGQVIVLMYHRIGSPEGTWMRTPENFEADLMLLYRKGYYLVNLVDLVTGEMDVPKGKTPVVLTFDDTAAGQISRVDNEWNARSAVGIINKIYSKYPDFGRAGSFYLNPKKIPGISEMLRDMVEEGFELGNHTAHHSKLKTLNKEQVQREIALTQIWIDQMVPGYVIRTMAMPHGIYPQDEKWAVEGESEGVHFNNIALLMVGSRPSVSPYSSAFNPNRIARVRGSDMMDSPKENRIGYIKGAVEYFEKNPTKRFISDGIKRLK